MDTDLRELLETWRVTQKYVDRLTDEEVFTIDTLLLLSDDMVMKVFDKVGSRATFEKQLNELRSQIQSLTDIACKILYEELMKTQIGEENVNSAQGQARTDFEGQANSGDQDQSQNGALFVEVNTSLNRETLRNIVEANGMDKEDDPTNEAEKEKGAENERNKTNQGYTRKRPASVLFSVGTSLSSLLRSCLKGKAVLSYYNEHKDLNDSYRNKLADVFLNEYLKDNHGGRFPIEAEKEMTEMILEEFPTECEEIWMSSAVSKREKAVGRGFLVKRYYHIRRELIKSGVIEKKGKNTSRNIIGPNDFLTEEVKESISWLNYNKQPWPKVLQLWKETSKARLKAHIDSNEPIETYFDMFPALKDKSGFLLFESDFDDMFPHANCFYTQWPILAAFVEKNVSASVLEEIRDSLTPEGKKVRTILAIPHLFSVVTVAKTKNKSFRPSRSEVAETLLMCAPTVGEINPTIEARLQKYETFNLKFSVQAIVVGVDEDSISKSFVRLNKHLFDLENPLKAINISFKLMHAVDAEYPAESKREWLFLERAVYGIKLDQKGLDSVTTNLVKEFNKFRNNH